MKNAIKRQTFVRGRKFILTLALFLLVFTAASIVKVQAADTIMGWLGGWSEDRNIGGLYGWPPDGNETGVGWISMNNTNSEIPVAQQQTDRPYNVTIDATGKVSGYAWANASNIPNSTVSNADNGLGWIQFDPSSPYPNTGCNGTCPNFSTRRNGDVLEGWARFVSIRDAFNAPISNSGGWQGWIKMSGANYGVDIGSDGEFCTKDNPFKHPSTCDDTDGNKCHCYAWNGETPGTSPNMAEGLGWIDFAGARIERACSMSVFPTLAILEEGTGDKNCKKVWAELADNTGNKTIVFRVSDATKIGVSNSSDCSGAGPQVSKTVPGNGVAEVYVKSLTDFSTAITGLSVEIDGGVCGSETVGVRIEKTIDCNISTPDSITISPKPDPGEEIPVTVLPGSDAACYESENLDCSEPGPDERNNIDIGKADSRKCKATEISGLRYGKTKARATIGSGTAYTDVFVKGPGWIETNP